MSETIKTRFHHKLGWIVISTGIGDKKYGAFIRKDNGSLKRFVPIKMSRTITEVREQLNNYKGEAIHEIYR